MKGRLELHLERLAMVLLVLSSFWLAGWFWANFTLDGRIDSCLDEGGAWHFEQARCVLARSSP